MVILVNEKDRATGRMEKMEAHRKALLHRAFSVLIFNSNGEMLLQQRALDKYHSPGLWANTCCSHPYPGEKAKEGALRRLKEEMGMEGRLTFLFKFIYKAPFENGLTEHEIDHVFMGVSDRLPEINPSEVAAYRYMTLEEIRNDMRKNPRLYTVWFRILLEKHYAELSRSLVKKHEV